MIGKDLVNIIKENVLTPRDDGALHFSSHLQNDRHTVLYHHHGYPEYFKGATWGGTLPLMQGTAVHEEIHKIMVGAFGWEYTPEIEVNYPLDTEDIIHDWRGTADAVVIIDDERWLIDYKTISGASFSFLHNKVKPEHLMQVSAYYNFIDMHIDRVGVLYLPTSQDYKRQWHEPVFIEVTPFTRLHVVSRMQDVERMINEYGGTRDTLPLPNAGGFSWKNNKREKKWELRYFPHYTSMFCPWKNLGKDDPCGCSDNQPEYIGCWYYYNGIDADSGAKEAIVHTNLDTCPGYIELTKETP